MSTKLRVRLCAALALAVVLLALLSPWLTPYDPNAQDIYGEIDRVLGAVEELSQTYGDSYSALNSELKRRDDSSYFYKYDRPSQNTQAGDRPKEYVLKELLERTWWEFRDKSRDISNQLYRQDGQLTL